MHEYMKNDIFIKTNYVCHWRGLYLILSSGEVNARQADVLARRNNLSKEINNSSLDKIRYVHPTGYDVQAISTEEIFDIWKDRHFSIKFYKTQMNRYNALFFEAYNVLCQIFFMLGEPVYSIQIANN